MMYYTLLTNPSLQLSDTNPNVFCTNSFRHPNKLVIIFLPLDTALPYLSYTVWIYAQELLLSNSVYWHY